ncbi:MAG: hypothetical protein BWY98_00294 [Tenericutes bacterium ADurb.BinA155]|nr:MAG: hypothetical protein BWY98_00294 [Tenericutes bacterium ADurb.BinA155]
MKSPYVLVLAAATLLAGCGQADLSSGAHGSALPSSGTTTSESSSPATSIPVSSATSLRDDTVLTAFLAACKDDNGRVSSTFESATYGTAYYGDKAIYNETGPLAGTGYIVNGSQGLFEFTLQNDVLTLGQPVSASTSILPVSYTLADLSNAPLSDFASIGLNAYTVAVGASISTAAEALYGLCGLSTDYLSSDYITAPMQVSVSADSLTCSFTVSDLAISFVVKDLGKVTLPILDTYLANPTPVTAPTAFNTAIVSAEASLFGEGITIPFPSGVTALFRQDVGYSDDDTPVINGISLTQFGKDISASYIAQLTAAGYVETIVSTLFGEETTYQKTISEQSETEGAHVIVVTCAYDSDYEETDIAVSLSVLPITHEDADLTRANGLLTAYNTATFSIPLLPASDKITKVVSGNSAPMNGTKLDFEAVLSIAAETDADAYVTAYDPLVTAAGLTADSTYNLANYASNGFIEYQKDKVTIFVVKTTSDSGVYEGSVTIYFSDSTAA